MIQLIIKNVNYTFFEIRSLLEMSKFKLNKNAVIINKTNSIVVSNTRFSPNYNESNIYYSGVIKRLLKINSLKIQNLQYNIIFKL